MRSACVPQICDLHSSLSRLHLARTHCPLNIWQCLKARLSLQSFEPCCLASSKRPFRKGSLAGLLSLVLPLWLMQMAAHQMPLQDAASKSKFDCQLLQGLDPTGPTCHPHPRMHHVQGLSSLLQHNPLWQCDQFQMSRICLKAGQL